MNQKQNNNINTAVMKTIADGDARMKSSWYFKKRSLAAVGGIIFAIMLTVFLVSLIMYTLSKTDSWEMMQFGAVGMSTFFASLPWIMISAICFFVIIAEILMQKFSYSYHRPTLYSLALIIGITLIGGFTVAQTSFHERVEHRMQKIAPPIARPLYVQPRKNIKKIHKGTIVEVKSDGFYMKSDNDDEIKVIINKQEKHSPVLILTTSTPVTILGKNKHGILNAEGIKVSKPHEIKKLLKMRENELDND